MDELDYKQIARNVVKLLDDDVSIPIVNSYVDWASGRKSWSIFRDNYKLLCKALELLKLPIPSREEWKKR